MFGEKNSNITELPKRKNNFMQNKYLKIASGFVICVFVSGTIFKTIDVTKKDLFTKGDVTTDLIMPITIKEDPIDTRNTAINTVINTNNDIKKTDDSQPTTEIAKSIEVEQLSVIEEDEGKTVDSNLPDKGKSNNLAINNTTSNENPPKSEAEINASLANGGKSLSVSIEPKTPVDIPKMDEVKEDAGKILKCYDSRYSFDEKKLVSVKDGGIYIKDIASSKETKVMAYNEKTQIVEKPNFTPNDGIIYYKAEKVTLEKGVSAEKNGAIYLWDKNLQESSKIVDGKSPMISKDGKKLVYESEGKIYILTLATKDKRLVDTGKYPAWADNGNLISYVKEEKEKQSYDVNTEKKDVYIEKRFSSLWAFDLSSENTRSLTNNQVNISNDSIQSWAEAVRSGSVTSNLDVTSKYSYFESIWSSNNKEIYVIRKNNEAQVFELIKFNLNN